MPRVLPNDFANPAEPLLDWFASVSETACLQAAIASGSASGSSSCQSCSINS
jgi:hypothetical protein